MHKERADNLVANRDLFHSIDLPSIVFNHLDWKPIYLPHYSFLTYNIACSSQATLHKSPNKHYYTLTSTHYHTHRLQYTHTHRCIYLDTPPHSHTRTHCGCLCIESIINLYKHFIWKSLKDFLQPVYNLHLNI